MKENFKRIFIEEKQEDLVKEQAFKILEKKDIQYDLFSVPGQSDTNF